VDDFAGEAQAQRVVLALMHPHRPHAVALALAAFLLVRAVDLESMHAARIQHPADAAVRSVAMHNLHEHGLAANLAESFLLIGEPEHRVAPLLLVRQVRRIRMLMRSRKSFTCTRSGHPPP